MDCDYPTITVDEAGDTAISAIHPDILQTHILTRLDGQTLASVGCASPQFHDLSADEALWRNICRQTWPSTADPRVQSIISGFPARHRSFYSDSLPKLRNRRSALPHRRDIDPPQKLISAVDIFYKGNPIFSKVHEMEMGMENNWFLCSPFRIDPLDPKETVPIPGAKFSRQEDGCLSELESSLTLSWILIDQTRNRAANLSSSSAVSVNRHWLTGEVQVRYATILDGGDLNAEHVQCGVVVTCGGKEGGEVHVREASLLVEDMEGRNLSGQDCLVILQNAMENREKGKVKAGEERERYKEYQRMKRERRERKQQRERRLDMACILTGVTLFAAGVFLLLMR